MGTLNFYGYFTDFRNIWCGKFSVFGGGTCISVWKGTSWKAQQHGSLNHSTDKKMDTIYVQYTKKKHKETMIFICYIGISYSSFNWRDCANSSLVLFALFRLYTRNFSPCFLSCPAFCPLQIITAASNNTSPTCCVPAGRGRGSHKREKNSLCHQEFYWAQIHFTTLRWTAASSWFRQLSMYWRSQKANTSY